MGPCKLTATRDESVNLQLSFDPNVDARYQLTAMVPLAHASAMRSGTVLGQAKDGNAALCDLDTGRVTRILPANSVAKAVNRRGDVAGESDGHPFVTYATDRSVVLDAISGHAVALNDGGVMLGIAYNPPVARRPTFTFDGSTVTWLPGTDFWGDTINNSGAVGGCIGMNEWAENGGIFQNRVLSRISPSACVDHLNGAGAAVGTNWSSKAMRHSVLWDGSSYDIWDLNEANDLADDGTIAGSIDFDGYFAGRTSDSYQFGLHAALYTDAQVQDLNFLTDTTGHPEVAHVAMERALAVDGGKILVSFRNGRFGVIEPVTAR